MRIAAGYQLTSNVRLAELLRRGGMGAVWVADHLGLGTKVAVKLMTGSYTEGDPMVARFAREASCTAQIKSPHVVHIYDHGTNADGLPYIVMELLEGEDLAERLRRAGPLAPHEVGEILAQLAKALGRAHEIGIVHRDIKLNNVFLQDVGGEIFVKLLDFGVAKQRGTDDTELTTSGVMVGTLVYMSPEQLHDARSVDLRTDIWSLGVLAYRALTGKMPFSDERGMGAYMLELSQGKFPPATEQRPDLPPALDAWFLRALNQDPAFRFPNARELSATFDAAVGRQVSGVGRLEVGVRPLAPTLIDPLSGAGRPSEASTSAGVTRSGVTPPPKSSRTWMLALGALAVALGVAAALFGRPRVEEPTPATAPQGEAHTPPRDAVESAEPLVPPASSAPSDAEAAERGAYPEQDPSPGGAIPQTPKPVAAPPRPAPVAAPPPKAAGTSSPQPARTGGALKKERDYGF